MVIIMKWYEEMGLEENPLGVDTVGTVYELVDRERECKELLYMILSGNMMVIEGKPGFGKTMLLMYAIDNFKGKGKVIYVDARKLNKKLDIEKLMIKRYGFFKGKVLGRLPRNMILLLDNVESISRRNCEKIRYYFDQNYLKSVILTTTDYESLNISEALRNRIGRRVLKLEPLPDQLFSDMVTERVHSSEILNKDVILYAYRKASRSIKKALLFLDMACDIAKEANRSSVENADIDIAVSKLGSYKEEEPEEDFLCPTCGRKLKKIGEYYRCEYCDQYCENCGALCDEEDLRCPECGLIFEVGEQQ